MKILFVVPTWKPAYIYGGTIVVTAKLAENLARLGHDVSVYTTNADGDGDLDVDPSKEIDVDGVRVRYFEIFTRRGRTFVAPSLWRQLDRTVRDFDVVHIHSWWNFLVLGAAWICKRRGVRPVFSPHGMFSDYILTARNRKKKELIQRLGGKRLLENTFLHVSSQMEQNEAKRIVPDWEGAIISNLVELPDKQFARRKNDVFTIGFLSRIDPKKGLDILIKALGLVDFEYKLLVGGSGEDEYVDSLKQLAVETGNSKNIEWLGWKSGDDKFEFLAGLDLFALTSHSENFAIVVVESLAMGTPVLISDQVGLFDYVERKGLGWVSTTDVDDVRLKLNTVYAGRESRAKIEASSPAVVRDDFDDTRLAGEYADFYSAVAKKNGHETAMSIPD